MYNDHLFRVSLKCLITDPEGKVLVVKESGRSIYDLPGGGMEHGEDIRTAISRELKEEINFSGNLAYEIVGVDNPAKLLTRDVWQCRFIFKVTLNLAGISAGEDADEIAFMHPDTFKDSSSVPEQKIYEYAKTYC